MVTHTTTRNLPLGAEARPTVVSAMPPMPQRSAPHRLTVSWPLGKQRGRGAAARGGDSTQQAFPVIQGFG